MKNLPLELVRNSSARITLSLTDRSAGGTPVDVSGAQVSVMLRIKPLTDAGEPVEVQCTKLPGRLQLDGTVDTSAPYDTAGRGGYCLAEPPAAAFPVAGDYVAEVRIDDAASGQPQTPHQLIRISVREEL